MTAETDGEKPDLTPRRRFLANLMGGRKGKRISVSNPTSIACVELMDKVGVHFPDAHTDASAMAELAAAGYVSWASIPSCRSSACSRRRPPWAAR